MGVTIAISSITQNSQSVANNTSNVTVKLICKWTYGSFNHYGNANGWLQIDGTKYYFSGVVINPNETTSGSQTLITKTVNVTHASDGTKTLQVSASFATGLNSSGTQTASASKVLTTIPRKSSLTVDNGTLGTAQTLTITEKASTFKHKLKYTCGDASGWILGGASSFSTANSVSWTPPLSLAAENTTGTSVSVTFTLYTYTSDGTSVGSNSYTKTFTIPASVKPSCTVAVTDPMGYAGTYGAYIQGLSKAQIVVTASGSQGSTIKSYKVSFDGKTYTAKNVTTDVISGTGKLTVAVTVTDSRGRTGTTSTTITAVAYEKPKITTIAVNRCDASGNASSAGAYLAVLFSAEVTALTNNSAVYSVQYKKTTADEYTTATLTGYSGQYSVDSGVFVFAAETNSSYNIVLTVTDSFGHASKTAIGSSMYRLWSLLKKLGKVVGIAFGKIAELEGVFEVAFQTKFTGGILHPGLEPETDLNDVLIPNTYVGANLKSYNYANCPLTSGTFTLEVVGMGDEGQLKQRLTYCHKTAARAWERVYHLTDGVKSWGEWICVSDYGGTLLWEGGFFMHGTQEINLAEPVSKQRAGIVLVFCRYSSGTIQNYHFSYHFVPKMAVAMHGVCGSIFQMGAVEGDYFASKYLYISDQSIKGNEFNDDVITDTNNGITYTNNATVLRYVIGV